MPRFGGWAWACGLAALLASGADGKLAAADIKILTTGAFKPVVEALVPPFQAATGHVVHIQNDTAGALARRVEAGEPFDVLVLTPGGLAELAKKGRLPDARPTELAKVGVGVAVKAGAPKPDISTVEAFKAAIVDARKIAMIDPHAGGSSGIYLKGLFERWGIWDQVKAKAILVPGGLVATRVVSGEADLAIHQVSEILAVKDAVLVGTLPREIQNYTVYAGAVGPASSAADGANAFLKTLAGPEAAKVLDEKGMMPAGS
jgi:molybdate transport system substrate-binding protein